MNAAPMRGVPLAAQYLHQAQYLLPHRKLQAGSRELRGELLLLSEALPIHLIPTRNETHAALVLLASLGELAPWMQVGMPRR